MNLDSPSYKKKRGQTGLVNFVDCLNASIQGLENYAKKTKEKLITTVSNSSDQREKS